jgi:phage terminase small subunit
VSKKYNLNPKQKKFADEYIITADAEASMIAAGYSPHYAAQNASKVLNSPKVRQYIKERMLKLDKPTIARQEEVLEYLTAVMRGNFKDETLRGVGQGEQVVDKLSVQSKERIRAAELLGKRYGMWTDKLELNGEVGLVKIVDDLKDDDS